LIEYSVRMKLEFKHKTNVRVRYGETDQMGYCYYGNYAQYFEIGRVEALRSLGLPYRALEEKGVMLPVSDFSVKYIKPAFYDDLLRIETTIVSLNGPRLIFKYEVFNEQNELLSIAETTLIFVDKSSMRPSKPTADFLQLIEKYEVTN
jgi:acyl-CoA thioester hydrolase